MKEIRKMKQEERQKKLSELQIELVRIRGTVAAGGSPESPGRIKEIRKTIARFLTVEHEIELGIER
jgi:large subunit ribosomal protein L29